MAADLARGGADQEQQPPEAAQVRAEEGGVARGGGRVCAVGQKAQQAARGEHIDGLQPPLFQQQDFSKIKVAPQQTGGGGEGGAAHGEAMAAAAGAAAAAERPPSLERQPEIGAREAAALDPDDFEAGERAAGASTLEKPLVRMVLKALLSAARPIAHAHPSDLHPATPNPHIIITTTPPAPKPTPGTGERGADDATADFSRATVNDEAVAGGLPGEAARMAAPRRPGGRTAVEAGTATDLPPEALEARAAAIAGAPQLEPRHGRR